ncbi:MAG: DUF5320 domain-containing protein [Candidatus Aenigmarchaeota archaeon]|nr:DUF5320 domain-containing protein [Candidatus Aenigmarchaeota archaeon]
MPGGDGTGPRGMGPMTGRRAGYCTGYNMPGYANAIPGRGAFGMGRRFFARGRGFGAGFSQEVAAAPVPQQPSKEERIQALEQQKAAIEEGLKQIEKELSELKK